MSGLRWNLAIGLLALGALAAGCDGCDDTTINFEDPNVHCSVDGAKKCLDDSMCGERSICRKDRKIEDLKCCERTWRACTTDSECCPGQTCNIDGRCTDSFQPCTNDANCSEAGDRVCEIWKDPDLGETKRCTFRSPPCGSNADCPSGLSCFNKFCVLTSPCNGSCPAGTACVPQNNKCHPYGSHCDLPPKEGHLVVFDDPLNQVYDICTLASIACHYEELPPLVSNDLGRHASLAARGGSVSVAMYDGQYQDLVVADYDMNGALTKSTWVDGVPATGATVGGPNGPRHGITEPGDKVGKYTSSAFAQDGTLHVAYYDETRGDLRYVSRNPAGVWSAPHRVDGAAADLGQFTSIALDANDQPLIAYFQKSGTDDPSNTCPTAPTANKALMTGVKFARAKSATPAQEGDWDRSFVACAPRPPPPCYGCPTPSTTSVCVEDPVAGGTTCLAPSVGCAQGCGSGQLCVTGNKCMKQGVPTELAGIPPGIGLFPSVAFRGAIPYVAWYDAIEGNLNVSFQSGGTAAAPVYTTVLVDGKEGTVDTGNVGQFPSLVIEASTFHLAYHDFSRRALRYFKSTTMQPMTGQLNPSAATFIDTGAGDPMQDGAAWVGADVSLIVGPLGTFAAYQNSTAGDLRLSRLETTGWKVLREWKDGSLGYFASGATVVDRLAIAHARIHTRKLGGKPTADHQPRLEIVVP